MNILLPKACCLAIFNYFPKERVVSMNANNKWKIAIGTWEFADEAVEKAYFTEELKNTLSYLRPII